MIELLIKYITDKGYQVKVFPGVDMLPGALLIRKEAKDQLFGINWCIPKYDLRPEFEQYLYDMADRYLWQIEEAIANYQESNGREEYL